MPASVCACAALAYAELATLIPTAGSAYTYTYSVLGEAPAWIVGWSLILEYSLACSTVAVGWSGYLVGWLQAAGVELPAALLCGPHAGGIVNLPAILVALAVAGLLIAGTRESATLNIILVVIKLTALAAFVLLALPEFNADNMTPFAPHGFGSAPDSAWRNARCHGRRGDRVLRLLWLRCGRYFRRGSEEPRARSQDRHHRLDGRLHDHLHPGCDRGRRLGQSRADRRIGRAAGVRAPHARIIRWQRALVALAALIALPSVILVMMYGQSRIFFVMARDGLLPRRLSVVSSRKGAPVLITAITGVFVAAFAGFLRLDEIAELANAGTLLAFIAVAACMMILRKRSPGAAAHLPLPVAERRRHAGHRGLHLPAVQPAFQDAVPLLHLESARASRSMSCTAARAACSSTEAFKIERREIDVGRLRDAPALQSARP